MTFTDVGTGVESTLIWPAGFSAWLVGGRAVLYDRDGTVVGGDGDILRGLGGSGSAKGFYVCSIGTKSY